MCMALVRLLSSLQAASPKRCLLRTLHVDSCGLGREDVPAFLEALDQVWCLHELKDSFIN